MFKEETMLEHLLPVICYMYILKKTFVSLIRTFWLLIQHPTTSVLTLMWLILRVQRRMWYGALRGAVKCWTTLKKAALKTPTSIRAGPNAAPTCATTATDGQRTQTVHNREKVNP